MKNPLLQVILLICSLGLARAESIGDQLDSVDKVIDKITSEIRKMKDINIRRDMSNDLFERALSWHFGCLSEINGSDMIQAEDAESRLIESIYGSFSAVMFHYERSANLYGQRDKVSKEIIKRLQTLVRTYPVGQERGGVEDLYFMQYIGKCLKYGSDQVISILKSRSWQGDEAWISVLFLAHYGDDHADFINKSIEDVKFIKLREFFNTSIKHFEGRK
jgi:hypothetical protein